MKNCYNCICLIKFYSHEEYLKNNILDFYDRFSNKLNVCTLINYYIYRMLSIIITTLNS